MKPQYSKYKHEKQADFNRQAAFISKSLNISLKNVHAIASVSNAIYTITSMQAVHFGLCRYLT